MSGRRRVSGSRRRRPKSRASQVMTDYSLTSFTKDFQSLANGSQLAQVLIDNSVLFNNQPVRIVKSKTQLMWGRTMSDERHLVQAVYRQTEGVAALALDDETTIQNATQNGQFFRRPHMTHTNNQNFGSAGEMDHFKKPIILKNLLLDDDDDVVISWTNLDVAFSASVQEMEGRTELWWKRV